MSNPKGVQVMKILIEFLGTVALFAFIYALTWVVLALGPAYQ